MLSRNESMTLNTTFPVNFTMYRGTFKVNEGSKNPTQTTV